MEFKIWYNKFVIQLDVISVFIVLASVALVVLTVLSSLILYRVVRILGRIDELTEGVEHVFGFFRDVQDNALVSGASLLIEKLITKQKAKTKRSKK